MVNENEKRACVKGNGFLIDRNVVKLIDPEPPPELNIMNQVIRLQISEITSKRSDQTILPVSVSKPGTNHCLDTTAFIDTGCQAFSLISPSLVKKLNLTKGRSAATIELYDYSERLAEKILFETNLVLKVGSLTLSIQALIAETITQDLVLGLPFLKKTNPSVNWEKMSWKFGSIPVTAMEENILTDDDLVASTPQLFTYSRKGIRPRDASSRDEMPYSGLRDIPPDGMELLEGRQESIGMIESWLTPIEETSTPDADNDEEVEIDILDALTFTQIASAEGLTINQILLRPIHFNAVVSTKRHEPSTIGVNAEGIPLPYSDFKRVFQKGVETTLPQHRPYDLAINLTETTVPKPSKIYPLSQKETQALEAYLEHALSRG